MVRIFARQEKDTKFVNRLTEEAYSVSVSVSARARRILYRMWDRDEVDIDCRVINDWFPDA